MSGSAFAGQAYEGRINGEYNGWDGETIYKLQDGHIIQQSRYKYHYYYAFSPKLIIFRSNSGDLVIYVEGDDVDDVAINVLK